ncbi:MAG: circadian clock protein KaiC [Vulcanimicrobiaceae bacterium]
MDRFSLPKHAVTSATIARSGTGIFGLDEVLNGGFPHERTTVVAGGPGNGKTVLALQFLTAGAMQYDEPGLMISFEESPEALRRNVREMSWSSDALLESGIEIVDGRLPIDAVETGDFDLTGLIAVASAIIAKRGIKRVAIDGIDMLFGEGRNGENRRREMLRIFRWLSDARITALFTMKNAETLEGIPARFGFVDFAADGVVQLRSTMVGELLRRTLRVVKLRGSGFVAGDHPYTISLDGIRVLKSPTRTHVSTALLENRLSTGVERLDRMLQGGYRIGTTTLISGLPGTSKTTLGAEFLWAGCRNGERVLFVGFDEPAEQMIYDARSVGIDLAPYETAGLLLATSFAAGSAIGDEHFLAIEALIDAHAPTRVVIDPISALSKAGGTDIADIVTERLVIFFKSRSITAIFTAVSDPRQLTVEALTTRVSTVVDTWIHLSFAPHRGERNRTLTIVKARGTAHSNQMREVVLSSAGVTLADVYSVGGEVLLGTERLRQEQSEAVERAQEGQRNEIELRSLDEERDAIGHQVADLRHRLALLDEHRSVIVSRAEEVATSRISDAAAVRASRFGDPIVDAAGLASESAPA